VLGALINSVFLIALCATIFKEAIERCIEQKSIEKVDLMFYVSCTGLCINLVGLVIFGHGHSHSHDVKEHDVAINTAPNTNNPLIEKDSVCHPERSRTNKSCFNCICNFESYSCSS
jgi:zinc transporter 1